MNNQSDYLLMNRLRYGKLYARAEKQAWLKRPLYSVYKHLSDTIASFKPDILIAHERKGRALVRGLLDECPNLPQIISWEKVLSSTMISAVHAECPERFVGKRILIFDDTIRTGQNAISLINQLKEYGANPCDICFCIMASHLDGSDSIEKLDGQQIDVKCLFKNLATYDFFMVRKALVDQTRRTASFILDTEHVDFHFKAVGSFREVVDALGRSAGTVVFDSCESVKNITVYYGESEQFKLPEEEFPDCGFTNIVKKCRVICSSNGEYSIVPLCLPSVPATGYKWKENSWQLRIFNGHQPQNGTEAFYQVGLIASIHVLTWAIKDLSSALGNRVLYKVPNEGRGKSAAGYDYLHLLPIYPNLNLHELSKQVKLRAHEAHVSGNRVHHLKKASSRRKNPWVNSYINAGDLDLNALKLVQSVGRELEQRQVELDAVGYQDPTRSLTGLRAREVFELARPLDLPEAQVSALFDVLIDKAILVTKIESIKSQEGPFRCVRTFRPDGEIVTGWVAKYTREWGPPRARAEVSI